MPCFLSKVEATLRATLDVRPAFSESVMHTRDDENLTLVQLCLALSVFTFFTLFCTKLLQRYGTSVASSGWNFLAHCSVFSILCLCRLCCRLQYPQNHRKTTPCTRFAGGTPSFSVCSDSAAPSASPASSASCASSVSVPLILLSTTSEDMLQSLS